jgi:Lon protease-like protein
LENGLLGITVEGQIKFSVSDYWKGDDDILHANAEFSEVESADSESIPLENQFDGLSVLLRKLENHPMVEKKKLVVDYDNLWDLGWRLSELIPIKVEERQKLLEIDDPWERLKSIERLIADLATNI